MAVTVHTLIMEEAPELNQGAHVRRAPHRLAQRARLPSTCGSQPCGLACGSSDVIITGWQVSRMQPVLWAHVTMTRRLAGR
jgi:hypothetical protein